MLSIPINVFPRGFLVDSTSLVVDPPHSFIITIIIFLMLSPSFLMHQCGGADSVWSYWLS